MNMYSWKGHPVLKMSTKEVGTIIEDFCGSAPGRRLVVRFGDREESFILWNIGPTPVRDYAWWFKHEGKGQWVPFGDGLPEAVVGPEPKETA